MNESMYQVVGFGGRQFVYSGLTDRMFEIDADLAEAVSSTTDEYLMKLERLREDEEEPLNRPFPSEPALEAEYAEAMSSEVQQIVLGVTENCNLRCQYCVYSGNYNDVRTHNTNRMNWPTAQKAIELLFDHCKNSPTPPGVTFYGGEPLMEIALIEKCLAYVTDRRPDTVFTLTTNGTLLGQRARRLLVKYNVHLNVSCDGPEAIHDRNRKTISGGNTFDRIHQNLESLRREAPSYWKTHVRFSAVLTSPVEYSKLAHFFNELELPVLASPVECYRSSHLAPQVSDSEAFDILAWQFVDVCRGVREGKIAEPWRTFAVGVLGPAIRRVQGRGVGLYGDPFRLGQCVIGARKVFVSPSGALYPCEKVEGGIDARIGHVDTGVDKWKALSMMRQFQQEVKYNCSNCWMQNLCTSCIIDTYHGGNLDLSKRGNRCSKRRDAQKEVLGLYAYLLSEDRSMLDFLPQILPNG